MKFRGLTRLPENKRFKFSPRYYDPIREEIENRVAMIESEMRREDGNERVKERISSVFQRRVRDKKQSFTIQALVVFLLSIIIFYIASF